MSRLGKEIIQGLEEALEFTKGDLSKGKSYRLEVAPLKEFTAPEIKHIRQTASLSQSIFAACLGVSKKTVEAWESGRNKPSGSSSRLLSMLEKNPKLIDEYQLIITK